MSDERALYGNLDLIERLEARALSAERALAEAKAEVERLTTDLGEALELLAACRAGSGIKYARLDAFLQNHGRLT